MVESGRKTISYSTLLAATVAGAFAETDFAAGAAAAITPSCRVFFHQVSKSAAEDFFWSCQYLRTPSYAVVPVDSVNIASISNAPRPPYRGSITGCWMATEPS